MFTIRLEISLVRTTSPWFGCQIYVGTKAYRALIVDMYRAKIAKAIEDEEGLRLERYPVFDMRRARREFQEKWGPKEDE